MKKLSLLPILLALMAWTMPDAVAQNLVVSGAPDVDFNGTYVPSGTENGKTLYRFAANNKVMFYDFGRWGIDEDFGCCYCCGRYEANGSDDTPPASGWEDFGLPVPGMSVLPEGRALTYSPALFRETPSNDGSMGNTITITYNGFGGDFLTGTVGENYVASGKVTVSNVPAGLSASIILSASNTLTFALNGSATSHTNGDDVSNLTVVFSDLAFDQGDAFDVFGYDRANLVVDFRGLLTVCASGCNHSTIQAAVNAASDNDVIQLAAETFTQSTVMVGKSLLIIGAGAGQTIVQANANPGVAGHRVFQMVGFTADIVFTDLTIRHGHLTSGFGAGVYGDQVASVELRRCEVVNNSTSASSAFGAAIYFTGGPLRLYDCLIANNTAHCTGSNPSAGGAIECQELEAVNCTFSGNQLTRVSGTNSRGGAINAFLGGAKVIRNCTFTGNSSPGFGGAVHFDNADNVVMENVILYDNSAPTGADLYRNGGTVNASHCIIGSSAANSGNAINGTSLNISTSDPLLEALADNGGPTFTHAIGVGSPAIGAGTSTGAPTLDQRGYARIGAIDIGAYQANGVPSWTGIVSNIWNNPANWAGGAVPGGDDDAYITSDVIITDDPDAPATCNNLTIVGGANLWVRPGKALTVEGNMTVNGSATLESSATGTGTIITLGTVGGSGTFIAQQYLTGSGGGTPDGRHWYVAPTVGNTNSGAFSAAGDNRLWAHDEVAEAGGSNGAGWSEITDDATALSSMRGYLARFGATETVEYSGGVFNTGNLSLTDLSRTGTTNSRRGYQLVANPYPSFLNWDDAYSAGSINLLPTVWYRTEQSGSMVFATYNALLGEGVLGATRDIHPGQAFWVRVDGDGNTGILAVNNDMRSHRDAETMRDGIDLIRLTLTNGTQTDESMVFFNDLASNGADIYDSEKQMAPAEVPQLWSNVEGTRMAINGINSPETQPTVPLGIRVQSAGNYTITATELDLPVGAWLEDIATGAFQSLDSEPSYTFTSEGGTVNGRFVLHFSAQVVGLDEMASGIDIFSFEKNINIILSEETRGVATVMDMAGRVITTSALQGQRTTIPMDVTTGIYIVRVETEKGVETRRVLLR